MERINKRQQTEVVYDTNNKKFKLENENKSCFEDLANETIYEIFDYLDIYDIYQGYFNLNNRFENLILHSNLPIQINISKIPKSNFEYYHKNIILSNKHRINYLRLSNSFAADIIFSPPCFISKFLQLETLIFDNINVKHLYKILKHAIILPKLHSLVLNLVEYIEDPSEIFLSIFSLPKLKSCKLTYEYELEHEEKCPYLYLSQYKRSPIEYLTINGLFQYDSLTTLFFHLPRLRHLSINRLIGSDDSDIDPSLFSLKYLKSVSLKLDDIEFNQFKKLAKYLFRHVEILRLTTRFNQTYLDAKRWEQLIVSYMPNLRIFDINHHSFSSKNNTRFHDLINKFNSSFWIKRKWFFTHQHDWQRRLGSGIFYSTDPYRRKDYTFYWEFNKQLCSHNYENNLNSVKHVHIDSKKAIDSSANTFLNATKLTIKNYFKTPDDSISTTLNRVIPLKQLTILVIDDMSFPFDVIIKLLYFTPNLHTLKFDYLCLYQINPKLIEKSHAFQYVSKTNQINNLEIRITYSLVEIRLIVKLFPHVKCLKAGINRKQLEPIMRCLLGKKNKTNMHQLFFLCLLRIPKICLKELNRLFQSEKLIENYLMKFVNRDLYLWW